MISLNEIEAYGETELLLSGWMDEVFSIDDEIERVNYINAAKIRAEKLGCAKEFLALLSAYKREERKIKAENARIRNSKKTNLIFETGSHGLPAPTISNFLLVLRNDEKFSGLKYNELSRSPEKISRGVIRRWTDADDAKTREYIERTYKFHSAPKCDDALRIIFEENRYNPVIDLINSLQWDGTPRMCDLLHKWMKCDDTPYTREVSRLIFAGGIHRIYHPGCKFDDTPVLIGTKQGEGKSTFVRWLAMRDDFFAEVTEIEGQKGVEAIEGAWICEMGELLALNRAKDVEAVKSFMTRQTDHYRKPYDKRPEDYPRMCIFIGTTNKRQFLTDKTGNRRFYPVEVGQTGYNLFDHEKEIKEYIRQCWAEAKSLYDQGELRPYADRSLIDEIRKQQSESVEDDYRVGMIEKYLEDKAYTCCLDIWKNALGNEFSKPTKRDSMEINLILSNMYGWERGKGVMRIGDFGPQKYWEKIIVNDQDDDGLLPF